MVLGRQQRGIARNTFLNLVGALAPLLLTLITLPTYLRLIGEARYGALTLVWLVVAYFGLFDLGLGRAIANKVARLSEGDVEQRSALVWTAVLVNMGFGVLGGVLLYWVGVSFGGQLLGIPRELWLEAKPGMSWLAIAIPIITVSSVLNGALEGRELFVALNSLVAIGAALYQVAPLVVATIWGPDLSRLIAAIVVSRAVSLVTSFVVCLRLLRMSCRVRLRGILAKQLLRYGGWVTVSAILSPILTTLDRMAVGALAGVQAVTYYAVPFSVVSKIQVLPSSLQRALFPRFSALKPEEAKDAGVVAFLGLVAILTPLTVIVIVLITPFLTLWVGPDMGHIGGAVAALLLPGIWINSLAFVPYAQLQAQGRPDLTAKFHLGEVIPYVLALWAGLRWLGVQGAAAAWSLRVAVDAALLMGSSGLGVRVVRPLTIGAGFVCAAMLAELTVFREPVLRSVGGVGLIALSTLWAWRVLPVPLRTWVWRMLHGREAVSAA